MEEKKIKLMLNIHKISFIYEGEDKEIEKTCNSPFINVEVEGDSNSTEPNRIVGQIHGIGKKGNMRVIFDNHKPVQSRLDKEMLKAIIKGIEYVEKNSQQN